MWNRLFMQQMSPHVWLYSAKEGWQEKEQHITAATWGKGPSPLTTGSIQSAFGYPSISLYHQRSFFMLPMQETWSKASSGARWRSTQDFHFPWNCHTSWSPLLSQSSTEKHRENQPFSRNHYSEQILHISAHKISKNRSTENWEDQTELRQFKSPHWQRLCWSSRNSESCLWWSPEICGRQSEKYTIKNCQDKSGHFSHEAERRRFQQGSFYSIQHFKVWDKKKH